MNRLFLEVKNVYLHPHFQQESVNKSINAKQIVCTQS